MAAVNKVILIGNLGKDPELKYSPNGKAITRFSLATSERWGTGENKTEKTEWHNIVMFDRLAEIANEYLRKGSNVFIEGRIQTRNWDDQAGVKHYITEIIGREMQMLGKRNGNEEGGYQSPEPQNNSPKKAEPFQSAQPAVADDFSQDFSTANGKPLPTDDDLPF